MFSCHTLTCSSLLVTACVSVGYLVFLYQAEEHEYEEGFGPSVNVRIGSEETTWKRSRNKWNPFEKIKTVPGVDNANDFKVIWDRAHSNSFYVTERMYYYLDRDKHKDKFRHLRAKLYITRLQQRAGQSFLLQFIIERASDDELEPMTGAGMKIGASREISVSAAGAHFGNVSTVGSGNGGFGSTTTGTNRTFKQMQRAGNAVPAAGGLLSSGAVLGAAAMQHQQQQNDVPSPRTNAMLSAFSAHLNVSPAAIQRHPTPASLSSLHAATAASQSPFSYAAAAHHQQQQQQLQLQQLQQQQLQQPQQPRIGAALIDHFSAHPTMDGSRIQSFPPMFATAAAAPRFYPTVPVASPSTPNFLLGALSPGLAPATTAVAHPEEASALAQLQLAQQMQLQQLFAQQALEYQQQRDAILLQQLREQHRYSSPPVISPVPQFAQPMQPKYATVHTHQKSRSLDQPSSSSSSSSPLVSSAGSRFADWRPEGSHKRQHQSVMHASDLPETATKRRSTEVAGEPCNKRHAFAPGVLNLAIIANEAALAEAATASIASSSSSPASTPKTTSSSSSTTERMAVDS